LVDDLDHDIGTSGAFPQPTDPVLRKCGSKSIIQVDLGGFPDLVRRLCRQLPLHVAERCFEPQLFSRMCEPHRADGIGELLVGRLLLRLEARSNGRF